MRSIAFALLLFCLIPDLGAQPADPMSRARKEVLEKGNYISPLLIFDSLSTSGDLSGANLQFALTFNSFVLNNATNKVLRDHITGTTSRGADHTQYDPQFCGAIESMITEAKDKQVVILNEVHMFTGQRYVLNLLLRDLYDEGFRVLALEALWEADSLLNARGFPVTSSGLYTADPRLANSIRYALQLGYRVIGYDDFTKDREYNQALNIYDKALQDSDKVLVLAGGDHLNKSPDKKKMAFHLWQLSGIEPFTIRQSYDPKYDFKHESCFLAVEKSESPGYDLILVNTIPEEIVDNFPADGTTLKMTIDLDGYLTDIYDGSHGYYVYLHNEWNTVHNAVPVVVYLIDSNLNGKEITLPDKNYVVMVKDREGIVFKPNKGNRYVR